MQPATESVRVLHVDDEPDVADLVATFLEREDDRFDIETARSANEGFDRVVSDDFDCVVSDYDMPGQNGIEFLEAVREEYPDLPFILYTGKGSEEVASDAISAGVTDYLQKESGTSQYTILANRIRNAVDRCHTRRELADREERLSLFFQHSPMGIIEWDENFDFVRLNDAAEEILGYDEAELVGRSWDVIVPESDRDAVGEVVSELLEAVGGYNSINENVREDGQRIVCEWHNRVVTGEDDAVTTIFSHFREITDRRRQERRFEAIFNNTYTFAGLMEPDGTLIEANDTALSFGGLDRDDVVGEPLWETDWIRSNADAQATVKEAVTQARGGELFRDEIRMQGFDREAIIDFSVRPITDERGEVTLLVPEGRDITERKEQERKRQQIVDRVTDAIVEVNTDWEFTLVNEQAEDLYDMDESSLLGRDFWEVFHGARDTRFEEEYRRVMESREPTSFVEYFSQLDGWFDISAYPKEDGGVAFYFVEVTEQRERQQELERVNTVLSTLFETLPVGVLAEDADRNVLAVNDRMFDLFELPGSSEEIRGADCEQMAEQVSDVFADSKRFVERINDLVTAREPVDNEELPLQDGRTFERDYRPIELPGGEGHLWVYEDITEQKEQRRRYEAVFNHTYQFTGLLEPDGTVIEANDTVLEFGGVDREDVLGQKMWETYLFQHSAETRERAKAAVERAAEGEFVRHELSVRGADRAAIVDFSVRPVTDEHGNVILLIPEGRDITERKEREKALQRERDRLDEFAGVVSHDLRTPLNVAEGRLELAQEDCDSEHLDAIDTALHRIDRITEDVLWLSREGRDVGSMDAVVVQEAIDAAWGIVADHTKHAELHYAGEKLSTVTVEADYNRLCQLLENLFGNAIEHGGETVTVTVGAVDDGFYVEDDGPGIPDDRREDVFTAGYSTGDEGTGFGLSIVKQIVEAHGWDIRVTDGSEGGARFEITGVEFIGE